MFLAVNRFIRIRTWGGKPMPRAGPHRLFDVLADVFGGITGGAIGLPGALVTIWCNTKGWGKDKQRATYRPFIFLLQIAPGLLTISLFALRGKAEAAYDRKNLIFAPGALLDPRHAMLPATFG